MTRALRAAPTVLAPGGAPEFGSFRGGLPRLDFGPIPKGRVWQLLHSKRWMYVAIAADDVFAAAAVVSLGYAATAMVFVLDRTTGRLLVDRSTLGPAAAASFQDEGDGKRRASFAWGRTSLALSDDAVVVDVGGEGPPAHIAMRRRTTGGAEPIGAVVPIDGGFANATEKRLIEADAEVVAGGRRFVLDRALVAFDHTAGFLARHTAWRWALGMGFATTGERVAFNVVQGFVGEAECGGWLDNQLFPFGEGRFDLDLARPLEPWRVSTTCGALNLRFTPRAIHAETKNVLLARSQFIQPLGDFEGTIMFGERRLEVTRLAGVTEHQDVVW